MRKIFTFLCAALMSVGMYATTEVTITQADFPQHGKSFTKDGVTVSAGMIDGMDGNIMQGGSFSTTLGNFTKIEVTAMSVSMLSGEGWSGNTQKKTWTGNASSVSFSGDIMGMGMGTTTLKFTIEEPTVAVTGVTLNQNEAQMTVGEELTLTATVNPGNATNKDVMWSSDNGYVATVDNGVVTAEGEGTATITVTTVDGEYTATCAVTVTEPEPAGDEITVTWNDPSGYGFEFTQDGVTLTCGEISSIDFYGPGTFTTDLGNFTKIEVTAYSSSINGDGWSGSTWTGNAASVSFSNDIYALTSIVFTIEPASTPEPAGEVTVVFAANDKTVERTVTLPHTFKCSWDNGMEVPDELDIIIHELYNDYYYCNSNMNASGSDQVEVGTEEAPKNDYITIKGVFEGTATVTGDYLDYIAGDYGEHNYSITISIKGDEPEPQPAEDVNITPNVDPDHEGVYYSTFFDSANKYALPDGVEAYIVTTVSGDAMQLKKVADADQTIPAGAGVILKSSVTPFTLTPSDDDAVSVEGNRLEGSDESKATPANCYVLAGNEGVGFYHYTADMLNPHKAYIIYAPNSGNQAPRRLRFAFDQATGMDEISQEPRANSQKLIENGVLYIIKNGVKFNAQGQMVK